MAELIAILRLGSMITGECSACHEVLLVKGSGTQTQDLSYMISKLSWSVFRENTFPTCKSIGGGAPSRNRDDTPGVGGTTKTVAYSLCALAVMMCTLVSCVGADAETAHPRVLVGGSKHRPVTRSIYLEEPGGFSVSDHLPFVEVGQIYFDSHVERTKCIVSR
jgi:hypothetical protein